MNEQKVKTMINREILHQMEDQSAASVLRTILFDEDNRIDWNLAYNMTMQFMPELKRYEGYNKENMQ